MQIQTFKIFCDLADSSSFSRAAEVNGITQSAVSQQVRGTEERLGVKLIERGRRNFSLTPEGRAFLEASREIVSTMEVLESKIQELKHVVAGELRVATIFSIGLHELPPCLKDFRHTFPMVDVRVEYRRSTEVYMAVLEGRADVGLVAYPSERRGLTATTFWRDKLKLICAPGHRLAGRRKIALNVLEGEKFIAFEPDLPTRREVDRRLKDAGVGVRMILEFDNIETVKRAVEIENGVSIVPETAVEDEVNAGSLAAIEIEGADMWRPLGALVRNAARVSPALREFLERLSHFEVLRNRHTVKSTKKVRRK
jgi:LysR family transcriptional regulator, transcriptional activator of the cysJI operon